MKAFKFENLMFLWSPLWHLFCKKRWFFSPNHLFSSCFAFEEHGGRPGKGMSELGISSVEFLKIPTLTNSSRILGVPSFKLFLLLQKIV